VISDGMWAERRVHHVFICKFLIGAREALIGRCMSDARVRFDAIGVVVDWIDACKQRRLDDLLNLMMPRRPLNAAREEAIVADPRWNDTGARGWRERWPVLLRSMRCSQKRMA